MSVQEQTKRRIPLLGDNNNSLVLLIAINVLVFILITSLKICYFLSYDSNDVALSFFQKQILNWFILPAPAESLAVKPWTVFTYMFTHYSVWALISTCLWAWAFGYILQDLAGNKKLIPIYLYGGLAGAVFFALSVNCIPALEHNLAYTPAMMGGGAAIMAVAVATTTLAPDYRIFPMINGGIPLWVLTVVFVAINFSTIATSGGLVIAHLAAGLTGFLFIKQLRRGNDWSEWMNNMVNWLNDLFNPEKKYKPRPKDQLFYKSNRKPFSKHSNISQQRLDEILDKINTEGYHMLTDEEKDFLKRASKEEL
ncbi:MAG: rhomboid family intramembrane serine protease [Sphingobacteriia bacterium]|nr:rhomboid family intramembrane serine protease [Sphingobacteriia bacterium]